MTSAQLPSDPTTDFAADFDRADVVEADQIRYSEHRIVLAFLSSGRIAAFDRGYLLMDIVSGPVSAETVQKWCQRSYEAMRVREITTAEARFYGEPDDRQFLRDTRRAERQASRPKVTKSGVRLTPETIADFAIDL